MAEFPIDIVVDPRQAVRGTNQVERSLGSLERTADGVRDTLRNVFAFVGVGIGINEIVQLTDAYTNLQNRLRTVTDGQEELTQVTGSLFDIAQRTRGSFEATAELYARVGLATRDLGVSQQQTLNFTESLNQAIVLSGASAQEANAGLIQLSQGLASGALRGEELNSVLEQLPVVADVIADSLNVTRGELRELGSEGRINAAVVLNAFAEAREELADRFGVTVPTISQSFVVFRNSLIRTIGAFNESSGAATLLSRSIIFLSGNMDVLLRSVSAVGIALGVTFAARAVPAAITAIRGLTVAIAANPFGLIAVGISSTIGLLVAFNDQLRIQEGGLATVRDVAIVVWEDITSAVSSFVQFFFDNFGGIFVFAEGIFSDINLSIAGFVRFGARLVDNYVGVWVGAYRAILVVWEDFPNGLRAIFITALNGAISTTESGFNRLIGLANRGLETLGRETRIADIAISRIGANAPENIRNTAELIRQAFVEGLDFTGVEDLVDSVIDRAEDLAQRRTAAVAEVTGAGRSDLNDAVITQTANITELLRELDQEIELLQLSASARELETRFLQIEREARGELTEVQEESIRSRLADIQSLEMQNEILEQIRGPIVEYQNTLMVLNDLLRQGAISQQEFNVALSQTQLASDVAQLRLDLAPDESATQLENLRAQTEQRALILQQAREAELISQQEFNQLSLELTRQYNQEVIDIENARLQEQRTAATSVFQDLSQIARGFAGEQSGIYRGLFAITKGFAIADTTVQIANAIAKAANAGPFPANLAAIAQVTSLTAGLVSQIQSTTLGFQNGGGFTVGGSGGTDSQLVSFRATPGENVTVRTPGQQRFVDQQNNTQEQPEINLTSVNVLDPNLLGDFLSTPQADTAFINSIQRNASQVNQVLGNRG